LEKLTCSDLVHAFQCINSLLWRITWYLLFDKPLAFQQTS